MAGDVMETFGKYAIVDRLATGGMAEILLARSDSLGGMGRDCVIKRILPSFSQDLQFVSMFIDEARITIGLDHANIVRLFDFGQHEGTYFMAMEYVDGTDLAALLRLLFSAGEPVPPAIALYIAHELCRGLAHAHEKRDHRGQPLHIVHRDVSPQNVLLSKRGHVKLTDFGIAAARNKLTLTTPGTVLGKTAYMAPEQALGEPIDGRCDLWAAGVILYEMLTGERLFAAESPVATIGRVVKADVPLPSVVRAGLPSGLDEVVLGALKRHPEDRYLAASVMASALAKAGRALDDQAFSAAGLRSFLAGLEWSDDTGLLRPTLGTRPLAVSPDATTAIASGDAEVLQLLGQLEKEPDLWTLVAVGRRCKVLGADRRALAAFRCAAAIFAYRGLLVQSLAAYDGARELLSPPAIFEDLVALGDLAPGSRADLVELVSRFKADDLWTVLKALDPADLGSDVEQAPVPPGSAPLFGALGPREFAQLAEHVRVRCLPVGSLLLEEGAPGDSLFALGRGRVVVHCSPGRRDEELPLLEEISEATYVEEQRPLGDGMAALERGKGAQPATSPKGGTDLSARYGPKNRVYLSALSEGDFFGEFSFLTERPRSATVEAITDVEVLEIDRESVKRISELEPGFERPLLEFYKERVVELMMAKSPVFSLLSPGDRRELLSTATIIEVSDEELVIEEGSVSDSLFFIKRGEVEVFRRDLEGDAAESSTLFINKLGQGQFFGEISALRGTPRTMSVRAMGKTELFRIERDHLARVLNREPRLRKLLELTIASRTAEASARVLDYHRILYST